MSGFESQFACVLCDGKMRDLISKVDRKGNPLRTVLCLDCGLVQTDPMPSEAQMAEFYRSEYRKRYKKTPTPPMKHIFRSGHRCLARLEKAKPHIKPDMQVLDLGSGAGEFVYLLACRDLHAQGVEPSEGYGGFAQSKLGVDMQIAPIEQAKIKANSLDIITAHHVIEHMVDPVKSFEILRKWLKPGGKILAEVPNVNSRLHAPSRRFHFAHLYNFNPENFMALGQKTKLGIEQLNIEPKTGHIFVVFKKNGGDKIAFDLAKGTEQTRKVLQNHTRFSHYISAQPYTRFFNNLMRPLREKSGIAAQTNPKKLLDRIYN